MDDLQHLDDTDGSSEDSSSYKRCSFAYIATSIVDKIVSIGKGGFMILRDKNIPPSVNRRIYDAIKILSVMELIYHVSTSTYIITQSGEIVCSILSKFGGERPKDKFVKEIIDQYMLETPCATHTMDAWSDSSARLRNAIKEKELMGRQTSSIRVTVMKLIAYMRDPQSDKSVTRAGNRCAYTVVCMFKALGMVDTLNKGRVIVLSLGTKYVEDLVPSALDQLGNRNLSQTEILFDPDQRDLSQYPDSSEIFCDQNLSPSSGGQSVDVRGIKVYPSDIEETEPPIHLQKAFELRNMDVLSVSDIDDVI